ncbi:MAG: hypothetical protein A2261_04220 [Candidatus Magasanikbacteria bacterium RIFOXYA2_FULL_44_8]|uniref:Uncharacterized protein n=1 Tax=Candidatus Magasanikbacteria bacterium RIFOXYA2_FULL_44_8 TaxID=1798696 RepID=A0A1F6NIP5_9BACT|nr:MAG: hypothetical protein A2261_04220 [Candidatus Magasanikbacteria bacterium RIFOXYA2_FULL_44_8]
MNRFDGVVLIAELAIEAMEIHDSTDHIERFRRSIDSHKWHELTQALTDELKIISRPIQAETILLDWRTVTLLKYGEQTWYLLAVNLAHSILHPLAAKLKWQAVCSHPKELQIGEDSTFCAICGHTNR